MKIILCATLAALMLAGCSAVDNALSKYTGGPIEISYDPNTGVATVPVQIQITKPQNQLPPLSANPTISVKQTEK